MVFKINGHVDYVGIIDWGLRFFHGEELHTGHGSSYNSYLIRDEKQVIVDTTFKPFVNEYIAGLESVTDLSATDYIIVNHAEPDHSGGLPALMEKCPNATIICTANGKKSIMGQYHKDWKVQTVKTGDKINIGSQDILFVEMAMIHWPDSMMSYLTSDKILFSNDAFGQHFADMNMYSSKCNKCILYDEALQYYANILTPYSALIAKKMQEVAKLNLEINLICPAHGVFWDDDINKILELYVKWSQKGYCENKVSILYDTMYESTRQIAEKIADGIVEVRPDLQVNVIDVPKTPISRIVTEIFTSKAVFAGSPTVHKGILSSLAGVLDEISTFGMSGKKAAAFGSYGWFPSGIKIINEKLKTSGFALLNDGKSINWRPTPEQLSECRQYGKECAENI